VQTASSMAVETAQFKTCYRCAVRIPPPDLVALVAGLFALSGCGRRASEADCRLIVDKSVELQLRAVNFTDLSQIRKQEEHVRAELQPELESCEGRRVTDRVMRCVTAASSMQELDRCLR
jgi:hypothetical protein